MVLADVHESDDTDWPIKTKSVIYDKSCLASHSSADNALATTCLHFDYLQLNSFYSAQKMLLLIEFDRAPGGKSKFDSIIGW